MGVKGNNPHNALVLDTFSQMEHASGLLAAVLPPEITLHLDLSTLELTREHLVDEKLRETVTDLLYRVATVTGDDALVYVLVEHQSTVDRWMMLRQLSYVVRIWDHWRRSNKSKKKMAAVIPVLLSHAPGGWTAARDLSELIAGPPELVEALNPYLPRFAPVIVDLAELTDKQLEKMALSALSRLVVLLLKHIRDGDIVARLPKWADTFQAAVEGSGFDALIRVLMYVFECVEKVTLADLEWIDASVGTSKGKVAMTLAEKLRQEGRKEGRVQQQVKTLLRLLKLRFGQVPAQVAARVAEAKLGDLELMAERVLTAGSLDEVLDIRS